MNKQKGFTLIELLAVILILGIIALIAIPIVSTILNDSKKGTFETTVNNIVSALEDKCSMQILKGYVLTTSYTFTNGEVSPSLDVKGKLPNSGTASVNSNCDVTLNVTDGNYIAFKSFTEDAVKLINNTAYEKGHVVYFNPESGLKCDVAAYTANTGASNNGIKTGCMKWYIYNSAVSNNLSVNMILDHNTTAMVEWSTSGDNSSMDEVATALATDTSTWNIALNARLITAPEVATIVENNSWTTSSYTEYTYFASKTETQLATCTSPDFTGCTYKWLYDRTATDATTYGALNDASSETYGYWTSSAHTSATNLVFYIGSKGNLSYRSIWNSDYGVRPVITVSKSLIS